ncbi:MAG: hypothetical protein IKQ71_10220 [Lachnospiraceae bacterium]|nr:hypothetical protein [Lachnospiraceae bacterium]
MSTGHRATSRSVAPSSVGSPEKRSTGPFSLSGSPHLPHTIKEKVATPATVTTNNLTYNGQDQALVTVDSSTLVGGTMYYAVTTENTAPADSLYTTSIPTATNVETYYIWYRALGDENHIDSDATCVTSKILAKISKNITFKVVNGSWNDGETKDKVVKLEGFEGDILKLSADKIPAVGTKPSDGYKEGSWDTVPKADTEIKSDTTYTYTYAKKEEVKPEPIVEPAPVQKIKLTAKGKGKCTVYAVAVDGTRTTVNVKVE